MRSMNARVHLTGDEKRVEHHNGVKLTFEQGWVLIEDNYGEVVAYHSNSVLKIEAKPTSFDRGSW